MNLPFFIARRYLFARKSTNAINIITGIAVGGLAIGTAAMILVMSVFNGFEELLTSLSSHFNPDVKITAAKGKSFAADSTLLVRIQATEGVREVSQTLEEIAFFEYNGTQDFGVIKGVDDRFRSVTGIDSTVHDGHYELENGTVAMAVVGAGMRNKLSVNTDDKLTPLTVYMPKRRETSPLEPQFAKRFAYPAGVFTIQQEVDYQYILAPLGFVRELLGVENEVSALEIKLAAGANARRCAQQLRNLLGPDFLVKDRYMQDEAFLRITNVEKWMAFAILSFMLLLIAFNLVGALWMVVLEKKQDIAILKSMGARDPAVRAIFLNEGLLFSLVGLAAGCCLALVVYYLQKRFGLIKIYGLVIDTYPISLRSTDFIAVGAIVLLIGLGASVLPSMRAARVPAIVRDEG